LHLSGNWIAEAPPFRFHIQPTHPLNRSAVGSQGGVGELEAQRGELRKVGAGFYRIEKGGVEWRSDGGYGAHFFIMPFADETNGAQCGIGFEAAFGAENTDGGDAPFLFFELLADLLRMLRTSSMIMQCLTF
jgi:hypothetical protein